MTDAEREAVYEKYGDQIRRRTPTDAPVMVQHGPDHRGKPRPGVRLTERLVGYEDGTIYTIADDGSYRRVPSGDITPEFRAWADGALRRARR